MTSNPEQQRNEERTKREDEIQARINSIAHEKCKLERERDALLRELGELFLERLEEGDEEQ